MKTNRCNRFLSLLRGFFSAPAIIISFFGAAHAETWDVTPGAIGAGDSVITGGAGTWDITNGNWTGDGGVNNIAWPNTTSNVAVFGDISGAVALGSPVTVNGITFDVAGYAISGTSPNIITLGGTTPTITANADASISAILAGTASLVKAGPGQLTLTGVNTYTTSTSITGGTLRLGDGTTQPTVNSTYATSSGATTKVQYTSAGVTGWTAATWTKFTGAGTLIIATPKNFDTAIADAALPVGFTGTLQIDGGRVATPASGGLGGTTKVIVNPGGHFGMWNNGTTYGSGVAFEIAGTGYGETGYEGAIRMGNNGGITTINGNVTLTANATVGAQGGTGQGIINGVISGAAGAHLTLGTSAMWGTMDFGGANTYSGTTTVGFGTLRLSNQNALQNSTLTGNLGAVTFNSTVGANAFTVGGLEGTRNISLQNTAAAAIALSVGNNNSATSYGGVLSGAGSLVKIGTGTLTLTGTSTFAGNTTVNDGMLEIGTAGSLGSNYMGLVTIASGKTINFNSTATQTWRGGLSGEGTLEKNGSGTLILDGISSGFTGVVDVNTGILGVREYLELGTGSSIDLASGTSLAPSTLSESGVMAYTSSLTTGATPGSVTIDASQTQFVLTSTPSIATPVVLPLVVYDDPVINGGGFSALSLTLPRNFQGSLVDNTQELDLSITGFNPTKWVGNVNNAWNTSSSNWTIDAVSTAYQDNDLVLFDDSAAGSGAVAVTLDTSVSPNSITVANPTRDYSITGSGAIAGGTIVKSGAGTLTLGTNNTFATTVTIQEGTLKVGHANALGSFAAGSGTTVESGGVLDLNGTALPAEPLTLNGPGISSSGALVNNSGTAASAASVITLGTSASIGGSGNMTLSGDLTGTTGLTKLGAGVTTFNNRKTYTGDTIVSGGILDLTGGGGAGGTIRGAVTVNTGASLRLSTGDATGYSLGTDRLTAMNVIGGNIHVNTTSNQTLGAAAITMQGGTLTGVLGSNLDFFTENNVDPLLRSSFTTLASATPSVVSGTTIKMRQNDGVIFNIADGAAPIDLDIQSNLRSDVFTNNQLVKNGAGTMRLSGLSTYAHPTVINAGALIVPSVQSSTAFTLVDGTSLSVTGTPGSSLSTGAMTFGTAGSTTLSVGNFGSQLLAANAPVKVTGVLTLDGTPTLNISGNFTTTGVFPVVSYGSLAGVADFQLGTLPRSVSPGASLDWNETNKTYDLTIASVNPVYWNGNVNGTWDTTTSNWLFNAASATYQDNDVVVMNDSAAGTTALTLNSAVAPSSLAVDNTTKNYSITGSGDITGIGALTKSGTGTLTLATINSYSGGTTVNAGTLQLGDGTNNGSVSGGLINNASVILNTGGSVTSSAAVSGTGSLTKQGAGTYALTGVASYTGATTISAGTLQVPRLAITSAITNNGNLVFNRMDNVETDVAGVIAGTGSVAYTGPSTAVSNIGLHFVNEANTYGGTTSISNSRVRTDNPSGFSTGAVTVNNGGQLLFSGVATTLNNALTLNGLGWAETAGQLGALRIASGGTVAGPITLDSASRISVYGGSGKVTGVISGSNNLSLIGQSNANLLVLSGSSGNTYGGTTTLSGVQVALSKSSGVAIPGDIVMDNTTSPTLWVTSSTQLNPTALLTFTGNSGNGRFNLMGTTQTFRGLVNNSTAATAVIQNSEATGGGVNNSPLNYDTGTLVLNVPTGEDYSFLNVHLRNSTGVLNLVKNGLGRQTVGGSTTVDYNGTTTVNAGELRFYDMDDTSSRAITIAPGATLKVEALTTRNFNGNIFGGATWSGTGSIIMTGAGIKQFNGNAATFVSLGSGALVDVQQGILRLGFGSQLNTLNNRADLNVASGATFNNWDCANVLFDALTGSGTVTRGFTPDTGVTSTGIGNFILGADNGSGTFTGVISDQVGNVGSILNLVKRGTGTQTLTGINDYDGTTRIEGGTLALSGSGNLPNTTSVTVLPGAVFDVSATTSGGFTQATGKSLTAGRTGAPANDIVGSYNSGGSVNVGGAGTAATLSVNGNLSLTGGGSLAMDVSPSIASGNDVVAVSGNLSLAGTTTVNPNISGIPDTANPYTLMTYGGTLTGDATNLTSGLTNSRYAATFSTATAGQVTMSLTGTGQNLTWMGNASTTWSAPASGSLPEAASLNWVDDVTPTPGTQNFQNLDTVTFNDTASTGGGAGAVTVAITGTVSPSVMTVNNPTRAYTFNTGTIAGGGTLTKRGASGLTLSQANTFTGGVNLIEGSLTLTNTTAAGTGTITIGHPDSAASALSLTANVGSGVFNNPITVSNNGTGTVTLTQPSNFSTLAGTLTLNRATTINSSAADRTGISGKITGNVGTLTFSGIRTTLDNTVPNDFVGNIEIATGTALQSNAVGGWPASTSVNVTGTGRLQFNNGIPQAIDAITGGTNGTTGLQIIGGAATTLTIGSNNGSGVFNGNIANTAAALSITKVGTGTQTFGGTNSNFGQTRVLGGTLALTNASALGGSTLVYNNEGGTVDFTGLTGLNLGGITGSQNLTLPSTVTQLTIGHGSNGETTVYNGTITLPGTGATFTKQGIGNLTLGGSTSNSWAGNTTVNTTGANGTTQGSLYLAKTGGAVAIPANTTVNFGTTTTGQANIRTVYDNQFGSNVIMNFGNTSGNWTRFDLLGTSQALAGVTGTATGAIFQNSGLGRFTGPDVADPATLVLTGSGTYSLTGAIFRDTDDGVNPLRRLNIHKTGSGTQTLGTIGGGAMTGSTIVDAGTLIINRAGGDDQYSSTAFSVAAGAVLAFDYTANGRLSSQVGDITGNGTLRKTGAGTTTLANNTGNTQIFLDFGTSGLVDVQGGALGSVSTRATNKADVQIAGGATLTVNGAGISTTTAYFDALNGGSSSSNATLDIGRTTVLGVNGSDGTDDTFFGNINGAGGITKEGATTLTLSGANAGTPLVPTSASTFSGNITVNGGKLVGAAKGSVFGSAVNTRTITANAGTTVEFQGPNAFGNHNTLNAPTLVINNSTVTNADPLAANVLNNGLHNVTLTNGTLTATAGNGVSTIDPTNRPGEGYGCWGLNGTVTSSGTSTISSSASGVAGRVLLSSNPNANGTGLGDTVMNVVDGALTVSAALQGGDPGIYGLIKTGAGKLVLSAPNIYGGPTTVNGGTLELTGSLLAASGVTSPSNITVASGATLTGTGTAAGTLAANGNVVPGSSIGTLATGAVTFGATGSLVAEINSSTLTADKLAVTGNLSIDPAATLNVTDLGSGTPAIAKLVLIRYTGTWDGGTFAGLADNSTMLINGNSYTLDYNSTDAGANAVVLRIGSADPFEAWASGYGLTGLDAGKGADPDMDGVKNILEFATNADPTSGSSGPRVYPLMHVIGADNALTYTLAVRKNAVFSAAGSKQTATQDMVVYTVEASNDLTNWTVVPVTEVTGLTATNIQTALGAKLTTPPIGADWEWRTFRTDLGAQVDPSDHIRLMVTEAP